MRLLHTRTYKFAEFNDGPPPPYAILSHRWRDGEISYQSFLDAKAGKIPGKGVGFEKIRKFCRFARRQRYEWAWIDTCCINKKNSAELTEAINSMYRWYQDAKICVVYLHDLPPTTENDPAFTMEQQREAFRKCDWFGRCWTLQELLAPSKVVFCSRDWSIIGNKYDLEPELVAATKIPGNFLSGTSEVSAASVAMRMSWASHRSASRLEDEAYCLLGLFQVNMPLLYGEGRKAFMRLQLEIIKMTDDESIFAWKSSRHIGGMLALEPKAFKDSGNVWDAPVDPSLRMPFHMTNKGLQIMSSSDSHADDEVDRWTRVPMGYPDHAVKLCCYLGDPEQPPRHRYGPEELWEEKGLVIYLSRRGHTWLRIRCDELHEVKSLHPSLRQPESFFKRGAQRLYIVGQPGI